LSGYDAERMGREFLNIFFTEINVQSYKERLLKYEEKKRNYIFCKGKY
jgi:hypothetical protein